MQDTLRSRAAREHPFLDQQKRIAMLDGLDANDPGAAAVTEQGLTVAMSDVFLHEGLGMAG